MNVAVDVQPGTALALRIEPALVLTDPVRFDEFYEAIRAEVADQPADVSTDKGRKEIAARAYKVARTKTAIDEAGKALNESARATINKVDAARRNIREKLDILRDEVRYPLTVWEQAEATRVQRVSDTIEMLTKAAVLLLDDTSATVADRLATVQAVELTEAEFGDLMLGGIAARDSAIATLTAAVTRLAQEEADRAELAALRAAKAEQDERDRLAAEAAAKVEREKQAAEQREREHAEREAKARANQIERDRQHQEHLQRAEQEANDRAKAAAEAAERRHQAELDRVQREAEQKAQAERDRIAREAAEAERKATAQKAEDDRKAANTKHRSAVMRAAKEALMRDAGLDEETAKRVVTAIVAGTVPRTSIQF